MKLIFALGLLLFGIIGLFWWNGTPKAKEAGSEEVVPILPSEVNDGQAVSTSGEEQSGATKKYAPQDVAKHADRSSCWTIVRGEVFDVTTAIDKHPGGADKILSMCGKDASAQFVGQHGGKEKPEAMLASLKIGALQTSP